MSIQRVTFCWMIAAGGLGGPAAAQTCVWRPWAADWSNLNEGVDLDPPNKIYDPTNWDYSFGQATVLNLPKDTPDGSTRALHLFADSQPPESVSNGNMSGGVYQEITVQPGVPLQYSIYWKGKGAQAFNWFEFLLIDGPYSNLDADKLQESSSANNPSIIRKREVVNGSFGWEQLTHLSPAHIGPAGPRAQTRTPTGSVVTVVLKCGHNPTPAPGGVEAFFDAIVIQQNNGPNLVTNGGFEDGAQATTCNGELMFQDATRENYWFAVPPPEVCDNAVDDDGDELTDCADPDCAGVLACQCGDPFADINGDTDVDMDDYARFQRCFTGFGNTGAFNAEDCNCLDRDNDDDVDEVDFQAFMNCATRSGVAADAGCDGE